MVNYFFFNNICSEIVEMYNDIINSKDSSTRNVGLKNILNMFSKHDKGNCLENSNKSLYRFISDDINKNGKINLIKITRRLKSLLSSNRVIPREVKRTCLTNIVSARRILEFEDISDVKLDSVRMLLSNTVQIIISFFIVKTIEGESDINDVFSKFDKNKSQVMSYIKMYYGIDHLITTQILTKLLGMYFLCNSMVKGGRYLKIASDSDFFENLNKFSNNDNKLILKNLLENMNQEFGGVKTVDTIMREMKSKKISSVDILSNPELFSAMNIVLSEIDMPKLDSCDVPFISKKKNGREILETIFGSNTSESLIKVFNEKHNMNPEEIIETVGNYKENINNGKQIQQKKKEDDKNNSFNFTEQDIDIIYTLNLIDALKNLGSSTLNEMYEFNKNPIDKNITINFFW